MFFDSFAELPLPLLSRSFENEEEERLHHDSLSIDGAFG